MAMQAAAGIHDATDMRIVRELFREYAAGLGVDLCFQGFEAELAGLPGAYAPPRGGLWLAVDGLEAAACVALRPFDADRCEMKRLFVRPAWRGKGLGRRLATHALTEAMHRGYRSMLLDTLDHMREAIGLYDSLGFRRIPAYYGNPISSAVYMEKTLATPPAVTRENG